MSTIHHRLPPPPPPCNHHHHHRHHHHTLFPSTPYSTVAAWKMSVHPLQFLATECLAIQLENPAMKTPPVAAAPSEGRRGSMLVSMAPTCPSFSRRVWGSRMMLWLLLGGLRSSSRSTFRGISSCSRVRETIIIVVVVVVVVVVVITLVITIVFIALILFIVIISIDICT